MDAFTAMVPQGDPTHAATAAPAAPASKPTAAPAAAAPTEEKFDPNDFDAVIEKAGSAKTEDKADEKAKTPAAPEADDKIFEGGPKALREAYHKVKGEIGTLKKELEDLRGKANTDQTPAEMTALKQEALTIKERLKAVETERDNYSKELSKIDVTRSPEFKQSFITPWEEAQDAAIKQLGEFTKTDEKGNNVPIEWDDIRPLLSMKTPEASARARELFGEDYQVAMGHRTNLLAHRERYAKAVQDHEAQSQNIQAERIKAKEAMDNAFKSESERLVKDLPDLYKHDDKTENDVHSEAEAIAHLALFGKEGTRPQTRIKAAAIAFKRAAMMPVFSTRLKAATTRIAELESQLAAARGNGPGGGHPSQPTEVTTDDIGSSMDAHIKSYR